MKKLILAYTLSLLTCSVFGDSKKGHENKNEKQKDHVHNQGEGRHKYKPSSFDVVPLNSPVKESVAKFLLKTPKDFEVDQVMFKIKNAAELVMKEKDYSPANLINGPKGKELHIPTASLKNGFYRLFIRVRTVERVEPKYRYHEQDFKNSYHDYVRFVVEKKSGVQMPDPVKNDATLAGIDSDNDGIRDDIQIWINNTYKDNTNVKRGVEQQARARQLDIIKAEVKEESILASRNYLNSSSCLAAIIGGNEQMRLTNELNKRLVNTKERAYAEIKSDSNFSGQIYTLPRTIEEEKSLCDFEIQ